jgi:HlyD family secretion protein
LTWASAVSTSILALSRSAWLCRRIAYCASAAAFAAARDAAKAAADAQYAILRQSQADLDKAKIDVLTADAQVKVAEADERREAALLAYTEVTAPYDGVVTVRNANTGDYVQAIAGDKSTSQASPIFVVARDDKVRVFVDVPEDYASYVHVGTQAEVRAEGLSGFQITAAIVRTSWSLHERTRTLRAEIDLPVDRNENLRPGRYVNVKVAVERSHARALPPEALIVLGNQTYCYLFQDGKALKTPVLPGLRDGSWVEVQRMKIGDRWEQVTGKEQVILADLSELADGQAVQVEEAPS